MNSTCEYPFHNENGISLMDPMGILPQCPECATRRTTELPLAANLPEFKLCDKHLAELEQIHAKLVAQ